MCRVVLREHIRVLLRRDSRELSFWRIRALESPRQRGKVETEELRRGAIRRRRGSRDSIVLRLRGRQHAEAVPRGESDDEAFFFFLRVV